MLASDSMRHYLLRKQNVVYLYTCTYQAPVGPMPGYSDLPKFTSSCSSCIAVRFPSSHPFTTQPAQHHPYTLKAGTLSVMLSRLMGAIQGLSASALLLARAATLPLPRGLKAVSSCLGRLAPTLGL